MVLSPPTGLKQTVLDILGMRQCSHMDDTHGQLFHVPKICHVCRVDSMESDGPSRCGQVATGTTEEAGDGQKSTQRCG